MCHRFNHLVKHGKEIEKEALINLRSKKFKRICWYEIGTLVKKKTYCLVNAETQRELKCEEKKICEINSLRQ